MGIKIKKEYYTDLMNMCKFSNEKLLFHEKIGYFGRVIDEFSHSVILF
jgi:hypothetical protein